jgi:hypothetical protein
MLEKYLQQLDDGASVDEEEAIFAEIRAEARNAPEQFIKEVRSFPLDQESPIHDIYEALSYAAEDWLEFFLEELERIVTAVRSSPDPGVTLSPLDEFFLLSLEDDDRLKRPLRAAFFSHLDDPDPAIRKKCVILLGDFLEESHLAELSRLEQLAREDADWRVRYQANLALNEVHPGRSSQIKLPVWIRLRARFSDPDSS